MAEGFESFHVPQQSRRDKLRVLAPNNPSCEETVLHGCPPGLLPFYDTSLLHSDLLSSATTLAAAAAAAADAACNNHKQNPHPPSSSSSSVKEEGVNNLLGYVGGGAGFINTPSSNSSSAAHHHPYLDLHAATATATTTTSHHHHHHHHPLNHVNPSSIHHRHHHHQDINNGNNNPFLYSAQNLRDFDDQSFSTGGDVVTFKQQALSSSSLPNESRVTAAQGLSLSLSSNHAYHHNLPLELNLPRYDNNAMFDGKNITGGYAVRGIVTSGASTSNDVRSLVPLGPFTGYASILKGSRFLKPAQQLLEELCDVGRGIYAERNCGDSPLMDSSIDSLSASGVLDESLACSDRSGDHRRKKMRLISLLEEVYRRYKLYYQQMQTIVASFESVAGLGNAAPYASFAIKAMSKHFKCLKNAITDQLHFTSKPPGDGNFSKDEAAFFGNTDRWVQSHRTIHNPGVFDHQPVWRPQRGLPERAVAVLRAWLFEHFLHPYPTDTDKQMLAKQTGLSRSQVSNWFINARVRLWKPMVEEIHMLETRQAQKSSDAEDQNSGKPNESLHTDNLPLSDKQVQANSKQKAEDHSIKRCRNEVPSVPNRNNEPMNFSYNNVSCYEHVGGGISNASGNSGVSLTLGLRQNNGVGLADRFPMNIARRFGVDPSNEGYVISGFEGSSRQFGKDISGQLLHDFVG